MKNGAFREKWPLVTEGDKEDYSMGIFFLASRAAFFSPSCIAAFRAAFSPSVSLGIRMASM